MFLLFHISYRSQRCLYVHTHPSVSNMSLYHSVSLSFFFSVSHPLLPIANLFTLLELKKKISLLSFWKNKTGLVQLQDLWESSLHWLILGFLYALFVQWSILATIKWKLSFARLNRHCITLTLCFLHIPQFWTELKEMLLSFSIEPFDLLWRHLQKAEHLLFYFIVQND